MFTYYDFPLNETGNRSLMIELMDLGFFPPKGADDYKPGAYISAKAGYRYIFSEETNSGFYIEPQIGYCRVVNGNRPGFDDTYGDGVAVAMEGGYALALGQNGHHLNFGLKYEADIAGANHTLQAIGFKTSYSFNLFRRRRG